MDKRRRWNWERKKISSLSVSSNESRNSSYSTSFFDTFFFGKAQKQFKFSPSETDQLRDLWNETRKRERRLEEVLYRPHCSTIVPKVFHASWRSGSNQVYSYVVVTFTLALESNNCQFIAQAQKFHTPFCTVLMPSDWNWSKKKLNIMYSVSVAWGKSN